MEEHLELWLGSLVCLALAALYVLYALLATPSSGDPFGHFIGVVGMILMLVTETVYSIRKRMRWLHGLGPLRLWLSFHIFTGIVGSFLVLLHSAFAVGGLAGFALIMTGIVVASGFIGRYIYTAVPRTRAGVELSRYDLASRAEALQQELDTWSASLPTAVTAISQGTAAATLGPHDWMSVFTRAWDELAYERRTHTALDVLRRAKQARLGELEGLLRRRRQLEHQIASLTWVGGLMGVWRLVHVPLGVTLFTAAFIHVAAALFFKGWRL